MVLKSVLITSAAHQEADAATRVLVACDDPHHRVQTVRLLTRDGHEVHGVATAEEALALLSPAAGAPMHAAIVGEGLADTTGLALLERIRTVNDLVQLIYQTRAPGRGPSREILRTLSIQSHHEPADGPEKLLHWVDLACRTYTMLARSRRSDDLKSQLVANVSHELRTPLNVILGYIELMEEGPCDSGTPEGAEAIVTIHRQALILLHLINDLLDLSKLQAGAMQLLEERVAVSEVVDEFRDALPVLLGNVDVRLHWELPPDVHARGDTTKVRLIVQNLVSNAAKFTQRGEISLRVRRNGSAAYVTVRDTGPGIRPEDHERIFGLFEQSDPTDGRRQVGTGIGLHLARALARLMGGDLTVESTVGVGSTFTLRLPAVD
jgi:signal transduction histidine kinase